MFNIFVIFLSIIKILNSNKICDDELLESLLTINDNFSYMEYQIDQDNNEETFNIYLGNELIYIKFKKSENIQFNSEYISFFVNDLKVNLIYPINSTKIHHDFNINNGKFIFVNGENCTKFIIKEGENINYINEIDGKTENIEIEATSKCFDLIAADVEYVFIHFHGFSNALIALGCLISLYGFYYYLISLMFHVFISFYYFLGDIISFFTQFDKYILFLLLFCFLIGISSILLLKTNIKNEKAIKAIYSMYGGFFGFYFFKTVVYYYIYFEFSIDFISHQSLRVVLYFFLLIIFISIGVVLNLFDIFKKYRYLPCSVMAGSFYIMKGLQYIIGGYFSSTLFIKKGLKFKNVKDDLLNYSLTYFLIHIIIIISSTFFQIKYLHFKEIEVPEFYVNMENNLPNRVSDLTSVNSKGTKGEEEEFIKNRLVDSSASIENGEDEINDQDD